MIRYYRLFDLLARRDMKKTDLLSVISAPTLAKLSKGANIQTDNIDKICLFLGCQPEDIMEVLIDETLPHDGYVSVSKKIVRKDEFIEPDDRIIDYDENSIEFEDIIHLPDEM